MLGASCLSRSRKDLLKFVIAFKSNASYLFPGESLSGERGVAISLIASRSPTTSPDSLLDGLALPVPSLFDVSLIIDDLVSLSSSSIIESFCFFLLLAKRVYPTFTLGLKLNVLLGNILLISIFESLSCLSRAVNFVSAFSSWSWLRWRFIASSLHERALPARPAEAWDLLIEEPFDRNSEIIDVF